MGESTVDMYAHVCTCGTHRVPLVVPDARPVRICPRCDARPDGEPTTWEVRAI